MAKTRKNGSKKFTRYLSRAYGPVGEVVNAAGNSISEVASYAGDIVKRTATGAKHLGTIWTNHTNMAIQKIKNSTGRMGKTRSRKGGRSRK